MDRTSRPAAASPAPAADSDHHLALAAACAFACLAQRVRQAKAPVAATAVALVAFGFSLAFLVASRLDGLAPGAGLGGAPTLPGTPVAVAVIGGLLLGLPLAIGVLHGELAQPLRDGDSRDDGSAAQRDVYPPGAWRRMTLGLVSAYGSAALMAALLLVQTDAGGALRALLAY